MLSEEKCNIHWCRDPALAPELAQFFAANITPEYISHSELQGPRALDVGQWRPGIVDIFAAEIETRVARERGKIAAGAASFPILEARSGGDLVAVGFASFFLEATVPYAILEDIVVEAARRGRGIGKAVIDWVGQEAERAGCKRIFLESGVSNHHAHELFEREGFSICSVVMMKRLSAHA